MPLSVIHDFVITTKVLYFYDSRLSAVYWPRIELCMSVFLLGTEVQIMMYIRKEFFSHKVKEVMLLLIWLLVSS